MLLLLVVCRSLLEMGAYAPVEKLDFSNIQMEGLNVNSKKTTMVSFTWRRKLPNLVKLT